MALHNPYQAYQSNAVTTASPGEVTLMLYNGCLRFMKAARTAIEKKDIEKKNENLIKAQNIISELRVTLNMELEVSNNLMAMYEYIMRRLIEANVKNDTAILDEAAELVTDLRDTWKQAVQLNRRKQFSERDQA